MAGLQQLRKRLKSIRATGQLAEAMRTAATIKYSRVSKVREEFTPYAGGSMAEVAHEECLRDLIATQAQRLGALGRRGEK